MMLGEPSKAEPQRHLVVGSHLCSQARASPEKLPGCLFLNYFTVQSLRPSLDHRRAPILKTEDNCEAEVPATSLTHTPIHKAKRLERAWASVSGRLGTLRSPVRQMSELRQLYNLTSLSVLPLKWVQLKGSQGIHSLIKILEQQLAHCRCSRNNGFLSFLSQLGVWKTQTYPTAGLRGQPKPEA